MNHDLFESATREGSKYTKREDSRLPLGELYTPQGQPIPYKPPDLHKREDRRKVVGGFFWPDVPEPKTGGEKILDDGVAGFYVGALTACLMATLKPEFTEASTIPKKVMVPKVLRYVGKRGLLFGAGVVVYSMASEGMYSLRGDNFVSYTVAGAIGAASLSIAAGKRGIATIFPAMVIGGLAVASAKAMGGVTYASPSFQSPELLKEKQIRELFIQKKREEALASRVL